MPELGDLPTINATLNGASAVLLIIGYLLIRRRRIAAHRAVMITAFSCSVLFLISYLTYHFQVGSVRFQGTGGVRTLYFTILLSHTVLAIAVTPMVLLTVYRALQADFVRHPRLARWTLPIWLYVSISGVVIYILGFHVYPPAAS